MIHIPEFIYQGSYKKYGFSFNFKLFKICWVYESFTTNNFVRIRETFII